MPLTRGLIGQPGVTGGPAARPQGPPLGPPGQCAPSVAVASGTRLES
jgi:hypothetical protein